MGSKVHEALMAARAEFTGAKKDAKNPHLRNRYPSLDSMMEACDEALRRHGLSYVQPIALVENVGPVLRTVLCHAESGETIVGECPLLIDSSAKINPMQCLGSAVTYARRYSLESMLGIGREDDDGDGAYPQHGLRAEPQRAPAMPTPLPSAAQGVKPFKLWAQSASAHLGITPEALVEMLDDAAVNDRGVPEVAESARAQRLGGLYHDREAGADWQQWMRDQCKAYSKRAGAPAEGG
jgi:hypothetical protein